MPDANQQDPNKQNQQAGYGPQAQNVGSGFVNLQTMLTANAPTVQGMVGGVLGGAPASSVLSEEDKRNSTDDALAGYDEGAAKADTVKRQGDYWNKTQSFGGLSSLLQGQYNHQAYNGGQSDFDTMLTRSAGGQQFQAARDAYQQANAPNMYEGKDLLATPTNNPQKAAAPLAPLPTYRENQDIGKQIHRQRQAPVSPYRPRY